MANLGFLSQAKFYIDKLTGRTDLVPSEISEDESSREVIFFDIEVETTTNKIRDIGAVSMSNEVFHSLSKSNFCKLIDNVSFICGHNIVHHDLKILFGSAENSGKRFIDTLFLSPLFFPKKPYHKLSKNEKQREDEFNNPVNDSRKAEELFYDEVEAFNVLPEELKSIFFSLLGDKLEFKYFFEYVRFQTRLVDLKNKIKTFFKGKICENVKIDALVDNHPVELAYALALINANDYNSVASAWLQIKFPYTNKVLNMLRNEPCEAGCAYCLEKLDVHKNLKKYFGYDEFRIFDGEPMQENAVKAAVKGKSLLTIFPTGGGKSLTFQLPAIMAGHSVSGLTVIISPLQSLMKDQVDNLVKSGISEAVTINGLLDPVERATAIKSVKNGLAKMLYISPEMLRSKTVERLLLKRNVVRFVIDEAHCFSAWGQDFRVDYLYIGDFIKNLQEKKSNAQRIPVSCFTATAKQKVIKDIQDYFERKLGLDLNLFASSSGRKNLKYSVIHVEDDNSKYAKLRDLIEFNNCSTIVYVARTKRTFEIAEKLSKDGIPSLPFNGKMKSDEKVKNQEDFIENRVKCIVATSAFGMGVDKKDVGLVVHFDISDSLENYVQEAGRAGRNIEMNAKCYVLYGDNDLDKHFILLNQTKLSFSEIQQVWRAVKTLTGPRKKICCSALEIARQAGWDDSGSDVETKVRTAISTLENAGYVSRGYNMPRVYASGIEVKNMDEARKRIENSIFFKEKKDKDDAIRIIKSLISSKNRIREDNDDAESRVDYIADVLGMTRESVVNVVELMRQEGVLANSEDMSAYISAGDTHNKSRNVLEMYGKLERFILNLFKDDVEKELLYKEINEDAQKEKIKSSVQNIRTLIHFMRIKGYVKRIDNVKDGMVLSLNSNIDVALSKFEKRMAVCEFVLERLFAISKESYVSKSKEEKPVFFSLIKLLEEFNKKRKFDVFAESDLACKNDIEEALLYLSKIKAVRLEGGFLVLYNAMEINKLVGNNNRYKKEDYKTLNEFYKQKIQQIHIVGEYANLMTKDYDAALKFVKDYFLLDFKQFISKYFKGERAKQIEQNITPEKYERLFGKLSKSQKEIIEDKESKYIVVAAGPGSGKTRVLVHKLASLLSIEEVKSEQLLMLTFSRAAAYEFKSRLIELIGFEAARFVEIKTFHSYCFDLIGKLGNLEDSADVVKIASQMIAEDEVEQGKISKTVLVIDEAQDMNADEFALVRALMKNNEDMRVIAVGDDDQNIYQFRNSDSKYMLSLITEYGAKKYELVDNYRSCKAVVSFANKFVQNISGRMKSLPINAVSSENGQVNVVSYSDDKLELPLVQSIVNNRTTGSVCVLTRTNEEALLVEGLLKKKDVKAKLIQSSDNFRFYDLAEVRFFLKKININSSSVIIDDNCWNNAKNETYFKYKSSTVLYILKSALERFEQMYKKKYRSDLNEFMFESGIEDFQCDEGDVVTVSTMHKAKGREFDHVYILQKKFLKNNEDYRLFYVAMTRAKSCLYIHSCGNVFPYVKDDCIKYVIDKEKYQELNEITILLNFRDVYLDHFKKEDVKREVLSLRSGDDLTYSNYEFKSGQKVLCILSKKMKDTFCRMEGKGFSVCSAKVEYVVAWRWEDEDKNWKEAAVLLPRLELRRVIQ